MQRRPVGHESLVPDQTIAGPLPRILLDDFSLSARRQINRRAKGPSALFPSAPIGSVGALPRWRSAEPTPRLGVAAHARPRRGR